MGEDNAEVCPYCGNAFSKHTRLRHEIKCFLKPENGKLLAHFLLRGLNNINDISWTNTYKFTKRNKISTSSTIIIQTDSEGEGWTIATIKLLLLFYENGIVEDFELYDLIIGKLSLWNYFQEQAQLESRKAYRDKYHNGDLIDSIPFENFERLIMAILGKAIFDYRFLKETNQEMFEDDGIIIDREETLAIIELYAPKIYRKLIEE